MRQILSLLTALSLAGVASANTQEEAEALVSDNLRLRFPRNASDTGADMTPLREALEIAPLKAAGGKSAPRAPSPRLSSQSGPF